MMTSLCFTPVPFTDDYVYYSPGVISPFFNHVACEGGKTNIQSILRHTIDLGRLTESNEYYQRYAPDYISTYKEYFGSEEYECTEPEYYKFFHTISTRHTGDDTCRSNELIRTDASVIKEHGQQHVQSMVSSDSDLILKNDQYTIYVPYSYDALRVLLGKTYSCFASESTDCMKGYFNVGAICYIIMNNNPVYKNQSCLMNLISKEIEVDMWVDVNGTHMLDHNHYHPDVDGFPTKEIVPNLSITEGLTDVISECKHYINSHYNKHINTFHEDKRINTDKGLFCQFDVKRRWMKNRQTIDSSHNTTIQQLIYKKILRKFDSIQSDDNFNQIRREFLKFNDNYFASVPTDDVQIHKLWRFWPISEKLSNIQINGKEYSSVEFFKNTYNIVKNIDMSTDHQGVLGMGISVLRPDCKLNAHTGYHNNMPHNCVFRMHLPLSVPSSDHEMCGLSLYENLDEPGYGPAVTQPTRSITWKEQELIVFDDSYKHMAWNKTSKSRAILMIDYIDNNLLVDRLTGESPLTHEVESVEQLARGWHEFFITELHERQHLNKL